MYVNDYAQGNPSALEVTEAPDGSITGVREGSGIFRNSKGGGGASNLDTRLIALIKINADQSAIALISASRASL